MFLSPSGTLLAILGTLIVTAHCTAIPVAVMETADLDGRWDLKSVDGRPVPTGRRVHFQIDGMQIEGFDGCNSFGGRLDQPGTLVASQRACADGARILLLDLSDPWRQLKGATVTKDRLVLDTGAGESEFTRALDVAPESVEKSARTP